MKYSKNTLPLVSFFLLLNIASYAQDTSRNIPKHPLPLRHPPLHNPMPIAPQFPGGKDSLATFLKRTTRYPKAAHKNHISGIVEVGFTVTVDGSIKSPTVSKSLGYGCDEEAIRVTHLMPKWIPCKRGNMPMEMTYHINVPFKEQEQPTKNPNK